MRLASVDELADSIPIGVNLNAQTEALLARCLSQATALVASYIGDRFERATYRSTYRVDPQARPPLNGAYVLNLAASYVESVSVGSGVASLAFAPLTEGTAYDVDAERGHVRLHPHAMGGEWQGLALLPGSRHFAVTYVGGYAVEADVYTDVPDALKEAALLIAGKLYDVAGNCDDPKVKSKAAGITLAENLAGHLLTEHRRYRPMTYNPTTTQVLASAA